MSKASKITLIQAELGIDDAEQILMDMFSAGRNFYQLNSFSNQERRGISDVLAEKNLIELDERMKMLQQYVADMKKKNARLKFGRRIELCLTADLTTLRSTR